MNEIQDALFNIDAVAVIMGVFIILFAIKEMIELISYFVRKLGLKTKVDTEKEKIEDRIERLEHHDNWQYEKINEMSKNMKNVAKIIEQMDKEQKERTVASYRATMYRLHKEFMAKGYLTQSEIETFSDLADIYTKCGGNHIFAEKIIPEVMALPIKDKE